MDIMTILWSIIGVVFAIWLGAILMFSIIGALAPYISKTSRRSRDKRPA